MLCAVVSTIASNINCLSRRKAIGISYRGLRHVSAVLIVTTTFAEIAFVVDSSLIRNRYPQFVMWAVETAF